MVDNCRAAAEAARAHGASGLLNTDWGDMGHLQYLPVSEPGFAYGAAVSEVEIDVLTGEFTILRSDVLYDAGKDRATRCA